MFNYIDCTPIHSYSAGQTQGGFGPGDDDDVEMRCQMEGWMADSGAEGER